MVKVIKIIVQVCLVYIISSLGNIIQEQFNLPIPGSIIGLLILFILLSCHILPEKWIQEGAGFLLSTMMFFFIPAAVGIINYLDFFQGKGLLLVVVLILSTCLVLICSGYTGEKLGQKKVIEDREKFSA
ncbi:CidA/LrgA family protein [Bacillus sp. 7884-1]|nr:CidA/LrgA family protein [Bacillus sp. 7884-1]